MKAYSGLPESPFFGLSQRFVMETVTVAASRGFTLSEMEILVGSAVVLAVLAWMVLSSVKHFRTRTLPRVVKN
jgi:Tfp pilus assembly protein FimT